MGVQSDGRRNDGDQNDERTRVFLLLDKEAGTVLRKEACLSYTATVKRSLPEGRADLESPLVANQPRKD